MKATLLPAKAVFTFILILACTNSSPAANQSSQPQPAVQNLYNKLPLTFEINQGQTDDQVKFLTRGQGYAFFLSPQEAVLSLSAPISTEPSDRASSKSKSAGKTDSGSVLRMSWLGASPAPRITGENELPGKVNYFVGKSPANWYTNLSTFARVRYRNIYPGVDLVFYGVQRQLEYDLVLAPGADPQKIALSFEGAREMRVAENGDLVLQLANGEVRQHRPVVYQEESGHRQLLSGKYVIGRNNQVGIEVANYDRSRTLVIDPTLSYSTYIGGSSPDTGFSIAIDSSNRAYITGFTSSVNFPTKNARQGDQPEEDAFVTKLFATGGGLIYSTYLGGDFQDFGRAIAVDRFGNAYVAGETTSTNFPTTPSAFQPVSHGGSDVFITKLSPSGTSLVYSTLLGGTDSEGARAIALDSNQQVYVTGFTFSVDFPLQNAFQSALHGVGDAFVTRLNATGTQLSYSTYLGGDDDGDTDIGFGIAVDSTQHSYVAGSTSSVTFPTTIGAFQRSFNGINDAFITKFSSSGNALVYSTYLGGRFSDVALGIALDSSGRAYVTGSTGSADFPVTAGAFQRTNHGNGDAFVTRLSASGSSLSYSTLLGGTSEDRGNSIAVNASNQAHVTGLTGSTNFPTKNPLQPSFRGLVDGFVTKLWATGGGLHYSTYLGGDKFDQGWAIRLDGSGDAYVTGETESTNFPTTPGAFRRTPSGGTDGFVTKIHR